MPANKRVSDLTDYTSVLPYASELFGVYRPMLGWKSKRSQRRLRRSAGRERQLLIDRLISPFDPNVTNHSFDGPQFISADIGIGTQAGPRTRSISNSVLISLVVERLKQNGRPPVDDEWTAFIDPAEVMNLLNNEVEQAYQEASLELMNLMVGGDVAEQQKIVTLIKNQLDRESRIAGALLNLLELRRFQDLHAIFYSEATQSTQELLDILDAFQDPLETFDPGKHLGDVTLSPIGIVHLFRQYFFELDSFLGTPVEHVWLSPGSMVELVEVSTRRVLVEKIIESTLDVIKKSESSETTEDEISSAVKEDNKSDTKLGFSTTVNQSWGTGDATATGSINLDTTQQTAREDTHKRSRQQTEKLSTEIRQSFKSTFRTVTETIDTSSKRFVLNNTTKDLINYELRRKMRQVGVQVQDVGTYLCWQTFVDNPGDYVDLPNLIHIAKPADLVVVPNAQLIPMPPSSLDTTFMGEMVWNFPSNERQHGEDHADVKGRFVPLNTIDIPNIPNDYEVAFDPANPFIGIEKNVIAAEDDESWNANNWGAMGMITADGRRVVVGISTQPKPSGLAWDDRITFKVGGAVRLQLKAAKRTEIDNANTALVTAQQAATAENQRKQEQAYLDSVKDRVTSASKIRSRSFEALREEERTIVYRKLISALMTEQLYHNLPETRAGFEMRHVLSELINSIFDVEKMLYFVAPEWWKPRERSNLILGGSAIPESMDGQAVRWADDTDHGKYFITDDSDPAPLGSSLGWLLQLDGDDLRNAFLNAPWVKAVIPIRPGKEVAANNWLQTAKVEGSGGLSDVYVAPNDELNNIASLLDTDPTYLRSDPLTKGDAFHALCLSVQEKHAASIKTGKFPTSEIHDDNRVSATPIDKVFEHGFYPLKDGFKAVPSEAFEVYDQWIEVLPTDQIVPVPVKYNPLTGRQIM